MIVYAFIGLRGHLDIGDFVVVLFNGMSFCRKVENKEIRDDDDDDAAAIFVLL